MKLAKILFPSFALACSFLMACGSDESEDQPASPQVDVDGGLGPQPDSAVPEAQKPGPSSGICASIGKVNGDIKYTTVYMKAPKVSSDYLAMAGYLKDANYAKQNPGWGVWCWGGADKDDMYCRPVALDGNDAIAYPASGVVFAPGHTSGSTETDFSKWQWYCEKDACPVGTFVVCSGKDEVCRVENGKLSGTAGYEKNSDGWSNILCTFPTSP